MPTFSSLNPIQPYIPIFQTDEISMSSPQGRSSHCFKRERTDRTEMDCTVTLRQHRAAPRGHKTEEYEGLSCVSKPPLVAQPLKTKQKNSRSYIGITILTLTSPVQREMELFPPF